MSDEVTLTAGGRAISGWTEVRIGAGVENCPRHFSIGYTELYPGDPEAMIVKPGDACQVAIGGDLVITGYVDRVSPALSAGQHELRIQGRGKCEDLIDSTAIWPSSQINGATALGIAQRLATPHGITVSAGAESGPPIPPFSLIWGETCWDVIERVCRWHSLLAYEGPDGNLILSQVGTDKHASGFKQGANVEGASITYAMDQRFYEYRGRQLSVDIFSDVPGASFLERSAFDKEVRKNRIMGMVVEAIPTSGIDLIQARVDWERSRRWGRANALQIVTDSWRDSAGRLWTPNMQVPLDLPLLKVPTGAVWSITDVLFERGDQGTHAHLTIMPPDALLPQPPDPLPFQEVPPLPQSKPSPP